MTINKIKIEKSDLALIQLRRSIQLFRIGDYVSSITLAGAANEIFGSIAQKIKGYNTLDLDKKFADELSEFFKKNKTAKGQIKGINNRIKNQLKHNDKGSEDTVDADFHYEAQCQIDSAIRNMWIASEKPIKDRIINNYVNAEWN